MQNYPISLLIAVEVKECNDGDVKFKNGASASRGEVEFCHEGRWMSVCNNGWGISETRAVCHQLKFDPKGDFTYFHYEDQNLSFLSSFLYI